MKANIFWHPKANGFVRITSTNNMNHLVYYMEGKIAKSYSGYRLILKDLMDVRDSIIILQKHKFENSLSRIIKQGLSFNVIITYGKCFSKADGRGIKLDKGNLTKYCEQAEIDEHIRVIHQRDSYVAHGGLEGYEHNPVVVILNRDRLNKSIIDIYDNPMGLVDIDSQLDTIESLVNSNIGFVEEKCLLLMEKIKVEITKVDLNELYLNSIDPDDFEQIISR